MVNSYSGTSHFIPLGSFCRCAYQAKVISEYGGIPEPSSFPFDWTITPFRSIEMALRGQIDFEKVLSRESTFIDSEGCITCGHTLVRFAHDLRLKELSNRYQIDLKPYGELPSALFETEEFENARGRFSHTCETLYKKMLQPRALFIRWVHLSVRKKEPELYKELHIGEAPLQLLNTLSEIGCHPSSRLMYVLTETIPGVRDPFKESPVTRFGSSNSGLFVCHLKERKGSNGNQAPVFYGDSVSWLAAFKEAFAWFESPNRS